MWSVELQFWMSWVVRTGGEEAVPAMRTMLQLLLVLLGGGEGVVESELPVPQNSWA